MYYLAEFLNYYPFLRDKVNLFLNKRKAGFCFNNCHMKFTAKSWEYLSLISDIPWPQNWFIYGTCTANFALGNIPRLPIYGDGATLSECDTLLHWFAENHDWAIIPWGGCTTSFNSFIFISRHKHLRDSFVNNCSNIIGSIEGSYSLILNANLSIAQYDIENDFSKYSRCVLINEVLEEVGTLLWQGCNLNDRNLPWVISFPMEEDDDELPFGLIENKDFRYITTLEFTLDPTYNLYPHERLGVYEPKNCAALVAMLQLHWQNPDILLVLSRDTNLNLLIEILKKTEYHSTNAVYSDLSCFQEILEIGEWFYKINADRSDYKYSMFISSNNQLINNIDRYCKDNSNYQSVTYF